jgi:class 3 adenylate cyclase
MCRHATVPCLRRDAGLNLDDVHHHQVGIPGHDLRQAVHDDLASGQACRGGLAPPVSERGERVDKRGDGLGWHEEVDVDRGARPRVDGHREPAAHGERHRGLGKSGHDGPKLLEEIGHVRLQGAYTTSAARDKRARPDRLARWRKRGWELGHSLGIAQGYATIGAIGAIGFEGRWDYGAIGTVTNLAARLCGEAAVGQILISSKVAAAVEGLIDAEDVGALALKDLARPVQVWRIRGLAAPG